MSQHPNVLFFITDQQASLALSAWGNLHVHTPHMDKLVQTGTSFRNAYCTSPVCTPARVSLVTGRMPHEVGVNVNHDRADDAVPTLGHAFAAAGYRAAWTGKTHTPQVSPEKPDLAPGFEYLQPHAHDNWHLGSTGDRAVADRAIEFLRDPAIRQRPWLLTVSLQNPHDICYWIMNRDLATLGLEPPTEADQLPPLPANFAADPDEPEFLTICRQREHYGNEIAWTKDWDELKWRQYLWVYNRLLERVDEQIGRVLEALRQAGLEDDTLIALTCDHGEGVGGHRCVVKLMPYQEETAIPLTFRRPGQLPVGKVDYMHLASGMDVMPTLCDYAGVPIPAGVRGHSLRAVIEDRQLPGRQLVVSEFQPDPSRMDLKGRILWTARHKYIAYSHGARPEQFFDLRADPGETKNLANSPSHREELARHRRLLAEWVAQTKDAFSLPV